MLSMKCTTDYFFLTVYHSCALLAPHQHATPPYSKIVQGMHH